MLSLDRFKLHNGCLLHRTFRARLRHMTHTPTVALKMFKKKEKRILLLLTPKVFKLHGQFIHAIVEKCVAAQCDSHCDLTYIVHFY